MDCRERRAFGWAVSRRDTHIRMPGNELPDMRRRYRLAARDQLLQRSKPIDMLFHHYMEQSRRQERRGDAVLADHAAKFVE